MNHLPTVLTAALAVLVGAPGAPAQDRTEEWAALRAALADPDLSLPEQVARLTSFVKRHSTGDSAQSDEVLTAQAMIGSLRLRALDVQGARAAFDRVVELAGKEDVDLRGRALYGTAQAAELQGEVDAAAEIHRRIVRELAGTRYADFARLALVRLERAESDRPTIGKPAPEFGPVLDRTVSARRLADLHGRPALLVFFDPADTEGTERVAALIHVARSAGLADSEMLAIAAGSADEPALAAVARGSAFTMPIVPSPEGFLSPVFISYEVQSVPATVLIGPDGTILGRDLPARRLQEILRRL